MVFFWFYLITLSSLAQLPAVAAATGVALPAGQVHPRVVVRVDRLAEVDCILQLLPEEKTLEAIWYILGTNLRTALPE